MLNIFIRVITVIVNLSKMIEFQNKILNYQMKNGVDNEYCSKYEKIKMNEKLLIEVNNRFKNENT